jgi:anaerobic magnesium-protoporphyrin IX monomethyl ester cyclase
MLSPEGALPPCGASRPTTGLPWGAGIVSTEISWYPGAVPLPAAAGPVNEDSLVQPHRFLLINALATRAEEYIFPAEISQGLLAVEAGVRALFPEVETRFLAWNHLDTEEPWAGLESLLHDFCPGAVGISAYSCAMPLAVQIASRVRTIDSRMPIILGGMHPTAFPEGIDRYPMFDYYVRGEGVRVCPRLLRHLFLGESRLDEIPSLSFVREGKVVVTPAEELPRDMDVNPPINWAHLASRPRPGSDIIRLNEACCLDLGGERMFPYEISQGCGYQCRFCERINGSAFRTHSPARVASDLIALNRSRGVKYIFFTDEHVHRNRGHFVALLDELAKIRHLGLRYYFAVRADEMLPELIDRMVDVGTRIFHVFPESGSPRIRGLMRKDLDIDRTLSNLEYASSQGIYVMGGFMAGWESETREDVAMTFALASNPAFDFVYMPFVACFARSELRPFLAKHGIEPDTPAYFAYLDGEPPIRLAAYGPEEYLRIAKAKTELNRQKAASPRTREKLEAIGCRLIFRRLGAEPGS